MGKKIVKTVTEISYNEKKNHFERIRKRYMDRCAVNAHPEQHCTKCGAVAWFPDDDGWWRCFRCGARGRMEDGEFVQSGDGWG